MTVTDIHTRVRTPRPAGTSTVTPADPKVAELNAMLASGRYAGYEAELQAARDELVALTAHAVLAA